MSFTPIRPLFALALLAACAGGGAGDDTDTDADSDATSADDETENEGPFFVSVDVTGLVGGEITLVLDGDEEIEVDEDGEYEFETELDDGDEFEITVEGELTCPTLVCRVEDDGQGEIDGDDEVLDVECGRTEVLFVSNDWSVGALRFVDDLFQYGDGETATTRVVSGESTGIATGSDLGLDSVAVDPQRDLVYIGSDNEILVFEGLDTLEGDVAPVRVITVVDGFEAVALELDVTNDRLYFGDGSAPRFIDDVSTAVGDVDATYLFGKAAPTAMVLDPAADRLYATANSAGALLVWDNVSTLTGDTEPDRVIDWSKDEDSFGRATSLAIDPCADRAYVGSNAPGAAGEYLFVLDDVSTLDDTIVVAEAAAALYSTSQAISLVLDSSGWLYVFEDSATSVRVFEDPASWSGDVEPAPDREILGAIDRGYGVAVVER